MIGSRAYGLDRDGSDTDRRGIYLPAASRQWSLEGVPEQIESEATQECYWELAKFLRLALRANPNVLETLYTPLVEHAEPIAQELLKERHRFLSKLAYESFNGYAVSQFRKIEQDVRTTGKIKWKHAMHLVRLLIAGAHTLRHGEVPVRVAEHRVDLLAIRDGHWTWTQVDAWRNQLHTEIERAYSMTRLPDEPDTAFANALLIRARRMMVGKEHP